MTLIELVTHLRTSILDDTGGSGVEWEDIEADDIEEYQLRWSNEELTRFINNAESMACRASLLLKSGDPAFAVDVLSGTSTYTLDPRIIKIKNAYLASTGKEVLEAEYEDLMCIANWRDKIGTPTHYILDRDSGETTLYPKPDADDTLNLLVYRLPMVSMDWNAAFTDTPDIKEEYQIDMLYYAAFLAYLKDEANTFDPQRAEYYRQLFKEHFSDTSAYGDTRRSRSRNRTVRYGGI